jgi:hypothetical protein
MPPSDQAAPRLALKPPARRRLTARAALILGVLVAGAILAVVSSAHSPPKLVRAAAARGEVPGPVIPTTGAQLPFGSAVTGRCRAIDHAETDEMRGWGVYTFDPARVSVTDVHGRALLPPSFGPSSAPPGLDAFASGAARPPDPAQWQAASGSHPMPASPRANCRTSMADVWPDSVRSGTSILLRRPGPYVYWTFAHTVHWVKVDNSGTDPTVRPCSEATARGATSPAPAGSPPPTSGATWHWAVASFCTSIRWRSFAVLGPRGHCPLTNDGSLWPTVPYINQYAAGSRLHLPLGRGEAGGNACGPSALLMAMLQSRIRTHRATAALPALGTAFDQTMERSRASVRPNASNEFVGGKAAEFLRHHGWPAATLERLGSDETSIAPESSGTDLDGSNEAVLDQALRRGPVLISTDFGTDRWGATGSGHMIVVLGRAPGNPGEYVVDDPAGNYFSSPAHHYGVTSCGAGVLYPQSWLYAHTTGAWYIELGAATT